MSDLYKVKSIFIAGHSGPDCDGTLRDDRSHGGMIYIFGGAHDHGLSRGNAIFGTRRSRKAIIPKAVLIKAQPRYIVAIPHTLPVRPLCTLPSRPIVHSFTLTSLPRVSLFHGERPYPYTSTPFTILFVDARIFFRDSSRAWAPDCSTLRSLPYVHSDILSAPRFIIFNDGHFIT